jgi:hypothetical protein
MPVDDQTANAAAKLDGQLRSVLQPLGFDINPTVGANLGSTLGTHRETPQKREKDAALTRQNVQEAAGMAIQMIVGRRDEILGHCLRASNSRSEPPAEPKPVDETARNHWRAAMHHLAEIAERLSIEDLPQ